MQDKLNKKIGQATKWSSITELIVRLISPVINMVLARILAPEAFGVVATITMVISFAEVFTDAGFQKYIIQHEFKNEKELDNSTTVAFWTNLSISILICAIIFFFKEYIAELVGNSGLGDSIVVASSLIVIAAFSSIQMARYKREFDFKTLFFVRMGSALIPLIVTLPLALLLRNYWALLIGNFASQLFCAIVLTVRSKWRPTFYYNFSLLKEMFSFSAWSLLESIAVWLTNYIGIFIVGSFLNEYYLGLYKTSMSTVNSYMSIITSAITPVLFSALSRYQNDEEKYKSTYYTFQRFTAIFVVPMGIGIYLFDELVTRILLGEQWMEASGFIGLWGLTSAFMVIYSHFPSEVYRSKGQPKVSLILQVIHLFFVVPIVMYAASFDFEILYTARSLVRFQMLLTAMIVMHKLYGFKVVDVLKNTGPIVFSALCMGGFGYAFKNLYEGILWELLSIFLCVITYFAILLGGFPKIRRQIIENEYFKRLLRKIK